MQGILQFVSVIVTSISMLMQLTVSPKLVQTEGTVNNLALSAEVLQDGLKVMQQGGAPESRSSAASCSPVMKMLNQKVTVYSCI